jgi:ABC-type Na+ efflux pump permease subunit
MRSCGLILLREYLAIVNSRGFIFGLVIFPIVLLAGQLILLAGPFLLGDQQDTLLVFGGSTTVVNYLMEHGPGSAEGGVPMSTAPSIRLRRAEDSAAMLTDSRRIELWRQIDAGEILGFIELPSDLESLDTKNTPIVSLHAAASRRQSLYSWLENKVTTIVRRILLQQVKIDTQIAARLDTPVQFTSVDFEQVRGSGEASHRVATSPMVPVLIIMGMSLVTAFASQPLLDSVTEERTQGIAQVLLVYAKPSQIMSGKLLGNVLGSLTVLLLFFIASKILGTRTGIPALFSEHSLPWLVVFQIFSVLLYGGVFMAIGAIGVAARDAQLLVTPVWLCILVPLMVGRKIALHPSSFLATALSFVPPWIPTIMMARISSGVAVPLWQVLTAVVILLLSVTGCVTLAGYLYVRSVQK